jgi:hypothetical protein
MAPGPWHAAPSDADDGWVGTRELPGYRAGAVVVRLSDLPGVDATHLYFDLLLLDESGRTEETHSGPCPSLRRDQPLDQRSRFVRVVAELLRHAPDPERGLAGLGAALTFIRENGVDGPQLAAAAQRIDAGCSEPALVASLCHVLTLSFGEHDAGPAWTPCWPSSFRASAPPANWRSRCVCWCAASARPRRAAGCEKRPTSNCCPAPICSASEPLRVCPVGRRG